MKKIIIIGSGIGGLATANLLARDGYDVHVYEKNDQLGGRSGQFKKDGFKNLPYDLTLALGSFGMSPLEYSGFYSMFPNYGTKVEPLLIKKVINRKGEEKVYESKRQEITSAKQSFLMLDMMKEVVKRGTGRNAQVPGIEIAGKTGTTNSSVDVWFCGRTNVWTKEILDTLFVSWFRRFYIV